MQTINLRKFKTELVKEYLENNPNSDNFYILYKDGTYKETYNNDELVRALEKDYIKPIRYIFDANDRIIIERKVHIDIGGINND